ncbi:MAG: LTA synthase family protein [Flavobacteriaceae bacterium]|jgi:phosphoglycerol transferase MdoB-like AlkP superfamily enzyme|nr:LTA synthase family protein [Flavobacteriaceae bacterium]
MKRIESLAFLKPLLNFFCIGMLIMTLSRIVQFFIFKERVVQTENYGNIFLIGLRFDSILMSYLLVLPFVFILLVPDKLLKYCNKFLCFYCCFFLIIIFFMELVTPQFIHQYDTRPNYLFLEYLIYPKEVVTMLLKGRLWSIVLIIVFLGVIIYAAIRWGNKLFYTHASKYKIRLFAFPVIAFLLFVGARGSLTSKRPINASNAVFSTDQMTNSLGLNSLYTVLYAAYSIKNEASPSKMYGGMDENEAYERVKKYMDVPSSGFTDSEIPFLHVQYPNTIRQKPCNVVIFLQESLGAEFVGSLGGMPLTPEFDKLTKDGLLFTNLYCTGTRSVRGIEAVVTGFLPSPSESVLKLSGAQMNFVTLAQILRKHGYQTSFIYGGMSNFDNMASFFNGNGFDKVIDETSFDKDTVTYAMKGTWGYSDEDLVKKANDYFKSQGDKPFFSLMFSTSNHDPFEFPDGRIELYEKPKNTVHNAIKYADFCIGKFLESARKEEYYKNTIFIIIADHNTRTYGKNLVPINKFKIPALIMGPGVPKGEKYEKQASQIDIPTTLLGLTGLKTEHPMVGRNLFQLADSVQGRSVMQFMDINAFRVENQVVILQPQKEALQFEVKNDTTLISVPLNPELVKDALAHVLSAEFLYKNKKYRLKEK